MTQVLRPGYDWTSASALSHTNLDKMPRGMIAYEDSTIDVTGITTYSELLQIPGVTTETGRLYKITCQFGEFWTSSAAGTVEARLFIDGTLRHKKAMYCAAAETVWTPTPTLVRLWTQATGTMDLSMQVQIASGTPTVGVYCGSDSPLLMLCEDIGPSS